MFTEVDSTAQHFVDFTEAEEDLVFRMHRLVGNRFPTTLKLLYICVECVSSQNEENHLTDS
jgi:hypothetical protein